MLELNSGEIKINVTKCLSIRAIMFDIIKAVLSDNKLL